MELPRQRSRRHVAFLVALGVALGIMACVGGGGISFALPSHGVTPLVGSSRPLELRADTGSWPVSAEAELGADTASSPLFVGGLLAGLAVSAVARRGTRKIALRDGPGGEQLTLCKTPQETYEAMVAKGAGAAEMSIMKTLYVSFMGGCYVGMAGLLSCAISGGMPGASLGAQKFVFAALFPVNLLLVLQSGAQLFTGNTATLPSAVYEGRANIKQWCKSWFFSYFGNVMGGGMMALIAWYTGLLSHGTDQMVVAYAVKKCSFSFGQTLVKGIMCNWLVCMAVFLSLQANDLTGKMVGIWFPISTFVAIGFEHSVANMFILPAGLLANAPLTVRDVIIKNLIPVTLGNAIAGAIVMAAGLSLTFGKLGKKLGV